ncbi:hypothetical protein ANO11243_028590 [Dothideomycetidae sp. 11243]|nr:hypothetical protein ANO11243_028590 [fungal sp. No.11243]
MEDDDAVRISALDPAYLVEAAGNYANYVGDQLQFTGFDLGTVRSSEPQTYLLDDVSVADYEDEWEVERRRYATHLRAMKDKDKALIRSANDKLRRAREKGKGRASLNDEEIEALERRRLQEKKEENRKSGRVSSGKSSRNDSTPDLHVDKARRKSGNRTPSSPAGGPSRSRGPKSPKQSRTTSFDNSTSAPAGLLVAGPDGRPVYAPVPYGSQSGYRSASDTRSQFSDKQSSNIDGGYVPYSPRYFTPQDYRTPSASRPAAINPRRNPADELHMPSNRARASSSVQHGEARRMHGQGAGRRNISGPADMAFSRLRQVDLASPLPEHLSRPHSPTTPRNEATSYFDQRRESSGSMDSVVVVNEESSASDAGDEQDARASSVERGSHKIERVPVGRGKDKHRRKKK